MLDHAKKRILVTGASGLVGHAIQKVVATFSDIEFQDIEIIPISSKDADLCNSNDVSNIIEEHLPLDGIIHLAANVGGLFKNMRYPVEMYEDNILMNTNILREAHRYNINNVVCILSTCIFPDIPPCYPITIDMLHYGPPHDSNEGYAYAKRMLEVSCRAYQKQYNRRYFCIVPTNVYGPNDNFNLDNSHVIPALIHKCWLAINNNISFNICGDGKPVRQFIYSEDLARVILYAYKNYKDISKPLIACPPNSEVSISDIVNDITLFMNIALSKNNTEIIVNYDNKNTSNGQNKKTASTEDIERFLPNMKYTNMKDGLYHTIIWFIDNINTSNIRK